MPPALLGSGGALCLERRSGDAGERIDVQFSGLGVSRQLDSEFAISIDRECRAQP
jgi:hypothetical protein